MKFHLSMGLLLLSGVAVAANAGPARHHGHIGDGESPFRSHHRHVNRTGLFDFARHSEEITVESQGDLSRFAADEALDRSILSHHSRGLHWPTAGRRYRHDHHDDSNDPSRPSDRFDSDEPGSNWDIHRGASGNSRVRHAGGLMNMHEKNMRIVPLPGAAAMAAMTLGGGLIVRRSRRR